jgi:hypothetical protein
MRKCANSKLNSLPKHNKEAQMAKQWACKCGHVNDPDESTLNSHKCGLCGRDKWLPYYIGGGGSVVLMGWC